MEPKIYLVGGAVRDKLLGLEPKDRDYVVVGGSVDYMLGRGFAQVGMSFPVFLHPETNDEYALARRERKVAPGYGGFEVEFTSDVTLEDDLARRDLTINSMAMDDDGKLVDPYGGAHDLAQGILRHTTVAFAEDPLRVLRLARFKARYSFKVADDTIAFCREMVENGELDALVPDRVWIEIDKMLGETNFHLGVQFLVKIGASKLEVLKPFFTLAEDEEEVERSIKELKIDQLTREERAFWFTDIVPQDEKTLDRARVPKDLRRRLRMMRDFFSIFSAHRAPEDVVKFFDTYRVELTDVVMLELYHLIETSADYVGTTNLEMTFQQIMQDIHKLHALDFTELVKTVPPREIRQFVFDTKAKTVTWRHLAS